MSQTRKQEIEQRRELLMGLREGDVIKLNGRLRVIRKASEPRVARKDYPPKRSFVFSIARCSWTHRPYCIKTSTDLLAPGCTVELVARNYRPKSDLDAKLLEAINWPSAERMPGFDCCDVKGVP
jgi:hypothetical protein